MVRHATIALVLVLVLGCGLLACGPGLQGRSKIRWTEPHDLVGMIVEIEHNGFEQSRELPQGVMTSTASVTRADAATVCFDIRIRGLVAFDGEVLTDPRYLEPSLEIDGMAVDDSPMLRLGDATYADYDGIHMVRRRVVHARHCPAINRRGWATCGDHRPVYEPVRESRVQAVKDVGLTACFDHGNRLARATDALTLRIVRTIESTRCRRIRAGLRPDVCESEQRFAFRRREH